MESNYLSLHYWDENHTEEYKEKVGDYLNFLQGETKGLFSENISVFLNDHIAGLSNGHVFVSNIEKPGEGFDDVLEYFLSKDRSYIPITISCSRKKDYGLIEKILEKNHGKKGKLTNNFLEIGKLFNEKTIKLIT